jgi:hypothetical protein
VAQGIVFEQGSQALGKRSAAGFAGHDNLLASLPQSLGKAAELCRFPDTLAPLKNNKRHGRVHYEFFAGFDPLGEF